MLQPLTHLENVVSKTTGYLEVMSKTVGWA